MIDIASSILCYVHPVDAGDALLNARHTAPRVLIVRLSALGDVIQTLPLLHQLRQQWPQAKIGWLVEKDAAPLLEHVEGIDRLHISHRKQWLKALKKPASCLKALKAIWGFVNELKAEQYHYALDVQGLQKSAVWPWLLAISNRIGYTPGREKAHWFYTHKVKRVKPLQASEHASLDFCRLLEPLGITPKKQLQIPAINLPNASKQLPEDLTLWLAQQKQAKRFIVACAPATQWASKHWPLQHWRHLQYLLSPYPISLLWLGGPADKPLVNSAKLVYSRLPGYKAAGKTSLLALFPLFNQIDLLIGPDSAPLHIADAVSKLNEGQPSIIGLYGPTASLRTGPTTVNSLALETALPCQPCHKRVCPLGTTACLQELQPEAVAKLVIDLVKKKAANSSSASG